MSIDYLKKILTARVYDVAFETPLEFAPNLSARMDNQIHFKREDMQSVFSFKLRGAYNKIAHLTQAQLKRGVICASAGNHAQGVALSAKRVGCKADAIFVAIGGGGLIAGVSAYVKAVRPDIKIIGVQTTDSDAMARSLKAGKRITLNDVGLFSDGTAVKLVGEETFRLAKMYVDEVITVDTDAVCAAIKDVFQDTRSILEPAGALAVAGCKAYIERAKAQKMTLKNETMVTIACGANMNFDRLRFVAERAEVGEAREAVFAVTIPEIQGSFKRFCELVGARNVTEFNYRISDKKDAHIFVGIQVNNREESGKIAKSFIKHGFPTLDLTDDELAKLHIRHLVGGKSDLASNELLYRFEFPERPGALMRFLNSMAPNWNISLFHYRNHG
ncbi:MAG: threonine ammonia-lyase, biosynthetic, partial [Burkholderiales bacterium]|nr:threonine ammonia-lyase, biosynthetic [Burkholderiales bacterium]